MLMKYLKDNSKLIKIIKYLKDNEDLKAAMIYLSGYILIFLVIYWVT